MFKITGWVVVQPMCLRQGQNKGICGSGHIGVQLRQQYFPDGCCVFICASGKRRRDMASAQRRCGCPAGCCCYSQIFSFWQIMHSTEGPGLAVFRYFYHICRKFYMMSGVPCTWPRKRGFINKMETDEPSPTSPYHCRPPF